MYSLNQYITEALKAEDYEAAIVMGWYEIHDQELDNKSGITSKTVETIKKNPQALEAGRNIADIFLIIILICLVLKLNSTEEPLQNSLSFGQVMVHLIKLQKLIY